jgi:chemotaxis protein histidine kinase CheA
MAELVGGTLRISSKPNVGTQVVMSFPSQAAIVAPIAVEQRKFG